MMTASSGLLTTVGTEVLDSANVMVHMLTTLITISGQHYNAILIGMFLGRIHKQLI